MENTAVARVSDDFYPTDAASWSSHLGICAYNSLFMAPLVQVPVSPFHASQLPVPSVSRVGLVVLWPCKFCAASSTVGAYICSLSVFASSQKLTEEILLALDDDFLFCAVVQHSVRCIDGPCSAFTGTRHLIWTQTHMSMPNVGHSSLSYHELESVFTNMIVIHLIIDSVSAA